MSAPSTSTSCLTDEEIAELAEGVLLSRETPRVVEHLAACPPCRRLVSDVVASAPSRHTGVAPRDTFTLPDVDPARYELGTEIARGGMGRILQAWDVRHERQVAMKLVLRGATTAAARFTREVRILSRLQHPSIVPLYEAGRFPDGEQFFAMRLVEGGSLEDALARAETREDRLALLPHLLAVTDALAYAHGQRVVHRDLKPSNVLVGTFGETVVIDWGLAKELTADEQEPASSHERGNEPDDGAPPLETRPGQALGTPSYMAPEQARGEPVGTRVDVYAIGAMLYHVVAGAPPYQGDSADAVLASVLSAAPPRLADKAPGAPADLVSLVDRAMARDALVRYASARELAEDLRRFVSGQRVRAHRYSPVALASRWVSRHRGATLAGAALVVSLSVTVTLGLRSAAREAGPEVRVGVATVPQAPPGPSVVGAVPTASATVVGPASATPVAPSAALPLAGPAASTPSAGAARPRPATGARTAHLGYYDYSGYEGDLTSDDVKNGVAVAQPAIDACFAASEFDREEHQFTRFDVVVTGGGNVTGVSAHESNPDQKLNACMARALRSARFRPTSGLGGPLVLSFTSRHK